MTPQGAHLLESPEDCELCSSENSETDLTGNFAPHHPRPQSHRGSRIPHPDYSWYREGFVRTGDASELTAQAILSWTKETFRSAPERTGLFACSVLGGDDLDLLLPPPSPPLTWAVVTRGSVALETTSARQEQQRLLQQHQKQQLSVRVSIASHPSVSKRGTSSGGSAEGGTFHVPTLVNPLICRRTTLYETGSTPSGPRSDFEFPQLCVGIIQPPAPQSAAGSSSAKPISPHRTAVAASASLIIDEPVLLLSSSTPRLDWAVLESYLLFQVVATPAPAPFVVGGAPRPGHAHVVGHAVMRVCDVLAGAVRQYSHRQSSLHSTIRAVAAALDGSLEQGRAAAESGSSSASQSAGARASAQQQPLEFFARLRLPIVPLLHSAASKQRRSGGSFASLDVELNIVLPAGLVLPEESLQAPLQSAPTESVPERGQWGEGTREADGAADRQRATSIPSDIPRVPPQPTALQKGTGTRGPPVLSETQLTHRSRGPLPEGPRPVSTPQDGGFWLGSRWSLGPGKEAQEARLARTLAAYSNVRSGSSTSRPRSAHGSTIGGRKSFVAAASPAGSTLHDDAVAAEAVTRTAALIRASVADLRNSIEDIEAELQSQTHQMQGLSRPLSGSDGDGAPSDQSAAAAESPAAGTKQLKQSTSGLQQQALRLQEELSHVMLALQHHRIDLRHGAIHDSESPPQPAPNGAVRPGSAASRRPGPLSAHAGRRPLSASQTLAGRSRY
jgi:hypothetical protein